MDERSEVGKFSKPRREERRRCSGGFRMVEVSSFELVILRDLVSSVNGGMLS